MKIFVGLLLVLLSPVAFACFAPPASMFRDHAALVSESKIIVIAQAVSASDGCSLRVVRVLKGSPPKELPIKCRTPDSGDWMTSFFSHTDSSFWTGRGGRLGVESNCSLIAPAFEIGHSYLLVLGVKPDTKQFEQIEGTDDKWLQFVERALRSASVPPNNSFKPKPLRGSA